MTLGHAPPRAAPRTPLIVWVRKLHLYLGVLFAPAILFFASTGALQVLSLHQSSPGYAAPVLLQRLAALHKDQVFGVPHRPDGGQRAKPKAAGCDAADQGRHHGKDSAAAINTAQPMPPAAQPGPPPGPRPIGLARGILKGFAIAAAIGLIVSTLLGLYMAYKFNRNRWLTGGLFAAGIVIPVILVAALPA
jgi:hypothetical protein